MVLENILEILNLTKIKMTMTYLLKSGYQNEISIETEYCGADYKDLHYKNRSRFGPSWAYYDSNITYKMNSLGYRMNKELNDVDFDNYIAFFGCSFCVGVGLPLEETYAYRLSKELDMDYINGAIGGGSPTFVFNNLVTLFKNAPKLPKRVIINWPPIHRTMYWFENSITFMGPNFPRSPDTNFKYWVDVYNKTLIETTHLPNTFDILQNNIKMLCNFAEVPLFEFTAYPGVENDEKFFKTYPNIHAIDCKSTVTNMKNIEEVNHKIARDVIGNTGHPGIYHQQAIIDRILKK